MKSRLVALCILALALCALPGATGLAQPAAAMTTFTVNTSTDDAAAHDASPGDGICADALGWCTLRAALEEANAHAGADTFANSMYILLDTTVGALPAIGQQLRLDASSAWDTASNRPGVTLNGGNQSFAGLVLAANNCEVYGLFLINFTDAIEIYSAYNTIGGAVQGWRNVIASNSGNGILINGPSAHHNVVRGNWIGLSITGDTAQPNAYGIVMAGGAYENTIGGAFGQGNYISGNANTGVVITGDNSDGNRLGANFIGAPAVGSSNAGNGWAGVAVYSGPRNTHIGSSGGSDLAGNLIAYSGQEGVIIADAPSNWVEANVILSNQAEGISVLNGAGNQILSNSIAGNTSHGVYVAGATATGNVILANSIHHNGLKGIALDSGGNAGRAAPVITAASASGASGTGCANCTIHLFSDSADEGETYEGFATANASGHWSYVGALTGPYVTATNTDAGANTSEFSAPRCIRCLYLPLIVKNY